MDLEDTRNAIGLSGFPDELKKQIWKVREDAGLLADYINWKRKQSGE